MRKSILIYGLNENRSEWTARQFDACQKVWRREAFLKLGGAFLAGVTLATGVSLIARAV